MLTSMLDRRHFLKLGAAACAELAGAERGGVTIGVQGYSFRDRGLDEAIAAARKLDLRCYELFQGHVEPKGLSRDQLREWRVKSAAEEFRAIRRKYEAAGIQLWSCGYNFREDFNDEEIAHGFAMARALGVERINASTNPSVVERLDRVAARERIYVCLHNHSNIKPNEFATPDDFARALRGHSEFMAITLDIGHFTAAGFDPVEFVGRNHAHIKTIHLKDRKKNQGANVAFGEGDTPIREVLTLLKRERYGIPALIEYEYKGGDTVEEIRRARDYCLAALA